MVDHLLLEDDPARESVFAEIVFVQNAFQFCLGLEFACTPILSSDFDFVRGHRSRRKHYDAEY